jgi:hypothetical protein
MACVVPTINLFSIQEIRPPKWRVALGFRQGLFEGFFRTRDANASAPRNPLRAEAPAMLQSTSAKRAHLGTALAQRFPPAAVRLALHQPGYEPYVTPMPHSLRSNSPIRTHDAINGMTLK